MSYNISPKSLFVEEVHKPKGNKYLCAEINQTLRKLNPDYWLILDIKAMSKNKALIIYCRKEEFLK